MAKPTRRVAKKPAKGKPPATTLKTGPIGLGDYVRDVLSGASGTVICIAHWINGCIRATVRPFGVKDGEAFQPFGEDLSQLEHALRPADCGVVLLPIGRAGPGGPRPLDRLPEATLSACASGPS